MDDNSTSKNNFECTLCNKHFSRVFCLKRHLKIVHAQRQRILKEGEILKEFVNFDEFSAWKEQQENETRSMYIRNRGNAVRKNGDQILHYYCNRSGVYNPRGKGIKTLKSQGSSKIGVICPARMSVKISNGKTIVHFFPKHENHEMQLEHLRLSQSERAAIAGRLKESVREERILEDIRNEIKIDSGRKILIDKKDIQNIKRDFNINGTVSRHHNDAESVRLWVKEMEKEEDNCVIYFKEQGKEDSGSLLKNEDFVLIIMTAFQKKMLEEYGEDKICLDGTHGLNNYDFNLYSILVVDEFKNGVPVAFCFSNRSCEQLFVLFFTTLKNSLGIIKCNTFMSDDAPAFYNAWQKVMGPVPNVLLCAWHVVRNWQQNLGKIKNTEKRKSVFKAVKVIRDELNEESFLTMLNEFLIRLQEDDETAEFGRYFAQHYASRPEKWAYCHRKGVGINTNMYLESLHKKIKYQYLEGKHVRRLDVAIDNLLKLVRDLIFQRLIKVTKKKVSADKMNQIMKSHKLSLEFTKDMIHFVTENEWNIQSTSTKNIFYTVHKIDEKCGKTCFIKCSFCEVCIHSFTCTCLDNVIRGNICKHIHSIAQIYQEARKEPETGITEQLETQDEILKKTLEVLPTISGTNHVSSSVKTKLESILSVIDQCTLSSEESDIIHKNLNKVLEICRNNVQKDKNDVQLKENSEMNVRKKIKKQAEYFSTKKKQISTSKKRHANPTVRESQNIKESLLTNNEVIFVNTEFDHLY